MLNSTQSQWYHNDWVYQRSTCGYHRCYILVSLTLPVVVIIVILIILSIIVGNCWFNFSTIYTSVRVMWCALLVLQCHVLVTTSTSNFWNRLHANPSTRVLVNSYKKCMLVVRFSQNVYFHSNVEVTKWKVLLVHVIWVAYSWLW